MGGFGAGRRRVRRRRSRVVGDEKGGVVQGRREI